MKIIFSRFIRTKYGKVLDAHNYGIKAFPIKIKDRKESEKPKKINQKKRDLNGTKR